MNRSDADMLRIELLNLIDQRHELVKLARLIDWQTFEARWSPLFESSTGRPALPLAKDTNTAMSEALQTKLVLAKRLHAQR